MSSGLTPHGEQAVARTWTLALDDKPRALKKNVLAKRPAAVGAAGRLVDGDVGDPVLARRRGPELLRGRLRCGGIGQLLCAREGCRVRGSLERTLRLVRVADVDHEPDDRDHRHQKDHHEDHGLAAIFGKRPRPRVVPAHVEPPMAKAYAVVWN